MGEGDILIDHDGWKSKLAVKVSVPQSDSWAVMVVARVEWLITQSRSKINLMDFSLYANEQETTKTREPQKWPDIQMIAKKGF